MAKQKIAAGGFYIKRCLKEVSDVFFVSLSNKKAIIHIDMSGYRL